MNRFTIDVGVIGVFVFKVSSVQILSFTGVFVNSFIIIKACIGWVPSFSFNIELEKFTKNMHFLSLISTAQTEI